MHCLKRTVGLSLMVYLVSGSLLGICSCSDEDQPNQSTPTAQPAQNASESAQTSETATSPDQPKQAAKPTPKPPQPADNSECLVCHNDFEQEPLSAKHEQAGVGCIGCHGPSGDHGGDELNILLPDVLFGRAEITPFCRMCHKQEDHPKGEAYDQFLKKWSGKYRPNGRMIHSKSICTDCHGNHAILSADQLQFPTE